MKCNIFTYVLVGIMLLVPLCAFCRDTTNTDGKPLNVQFQYAGNLGLVSGGAGTSFFKDNLDVFLVYGYLPKSINGTAVHTFDLKLSCDLAKVKITPKLATGFYNGVNIFYSYTRNTFIKHPDYYPDEYYMTNAFHVSLYLGSQLILFINDPVIRSISIFGELGTIDFQLWNAISTQYVTLYDIWNMSFGIAISF